VIHFLASFDYIAWVAIGVIDHLKRVYETTPHFQANPPVLMARAVIELETNQTIAALQEISELRIDPM
jgi:hypothetical protein